MNRKMGRGITKDDADGGNGGLVRWVDGDVMRLKESRPTAADNWHAEFFWESLRCNVEEDGDSDSGVQW